MPQAVFRQLFRDKHIPVPFTRDNDTVDNAEINKCQIRKILCQKH